MNKSEEKIIKEFNQRFTFEGTGDWIDDDKLDAKTIKDFILSALAQQREVACVNCKKIL